MNTDITKQMEMVLYRTEDDNITVSALIKDETIWFTQKVIAELFSIDKSQDNKKYITTNYYNLDVIISVGFCRI